MKKNTLVNMMGVLAAQNLGTLFGRGGGGGHYSVTRLNGGDASHTKKGPGRASSYQDNGYRKPGAAAAEKRLRKMTGANRM